MKKYKKILLLNLFAVIFILSLLLCNCQTKPVDIGNLCDFYIDAWKEFYPSAAFAAGDKDSAFRFEELSGETISQWLKVNRDTLTKLQNIKQELSFDDKVDVRILKRTVASEIRRWQEEKTHENSPSLYSGMISQALTYVLVRDNLTPEEKVKAITNRLAGIRKLCAFAVDNLKSGRPAGTKRSIHGLKASARFFAENLPGIVNKELEQKLLRGVQGGSFHEKRPPARRRQDIKDLEKKCSETASALKGLASHIEEKVVPAITGSDTLGKDKYAKELKLYTGLDLTPEKLAKISLEEILRVRDLMTKTARDYWQEAYGGQEIPPGIKSCLDKALQDMEDDREDNQKDFLQLFLDLIDRAETFVKEKNIAPVPGKRTLFTDLSPAHFAGAAVGGVYSAGPFDPAADTLFYLPTVPDSAPEEAKEGFYRSFNNHFNTMIITHEMFPGHYLHLKIAAGIPRKIRSLFCGSLYAEGWATLCEQLTLDAGWNKDNKLTRLAHYRKILENATRAYTSVQVHCNGWNKDQLTDFAVNTGLLAPQFAVNLWHRVIGSPFQLTSYFLGFKAFAAVYEQEKKKKGEAFSLYDFSKKILYAGSLPIDMLPELFDN